MVSINSREDELNERDTGGNDITSRTGDQWFY